MSIRTALCLCAATAAAHAGELVYGVTDTQTLVSFAANAPEAILTGVAIQGARTNERIHGIDFRPATGELFALGSFGNLYTLNPLTGQLTQVGSTFATPLNGSSFGFDFNPTIDRIRTVSEANQNLVLNPNDGVATPVTPLFYRAGDVNQGVDPNVVGSAYTNNFAGATTSQLFGIDTGLDILVKQANSEGTLDTVGSLGVDLTDDLGFDISGRSGIAYAAVLDAGSSTFWRINLDTGAATGIGAIGGGATVTGIAVVPAPGVLAALAGAALPITRRRR